MNATIELGAVTTREGARLHIASGCGWSHLLTGAGLVPLTEVNADRTCRNCHKAIRAALEAAQTANGEQTEYSYAVKIDKIKVAGRLTALVNLFLTAAETAREAELKSRFVRPVAVAETELARRLAIVEQYRAAEDEEPELVPLSAFGAIKARYAATHPETTGRVAHVNLAA